jgi:predicted nucleic acid-binding Zn ribbon protein
MTWRQKPDDLSPAVSVTNSLEAVVKRLGGGSVKTQQSVFAAWPEAVGADVRDHATPIALVDGVLTVEVDDARWLTQLKWLGGRVADRLNEASGTELVERLNVRLTSPKSK